MMIRVVGDVVRSGVAVIAAVGAALSACFLYLAGRRAERVRRYRDAEVARARAEDAARRYDRQGGAAERLREGRF